MSPEPSISLHVPVAQRRQFVVACIALWVGAAGFWWLCASFRRWEDVKEWTFGGCLMVLVLIGQWILERRLRRKWLPFQGQTQWCLRAMLLTPVFAIFLVWAVKPIGAMIPGFYRASNEGTVGSKTNVEGRPVIMSFSEQLKSEPTLKLRLPERYRTEVLRFHPRLRPDSPGWIIRTGEKLIRKEDGTAGQPMSGEGLMRVLEDISGNKIPLSEEAEVILQLDLLSKEWLLGNRFEARISRSDDRLMVDAHGSSGSPQPSLPHALVGIVLFFVSLAISITAKATMGEEPCERP